jgi:ABC-type transporter Mla maintaining outer membrane lipid asymmetry permease subunit MlaE
VSERSLLASLRAPSFELLRLLGGIAVLSGRTFRAGLKPPFEGGELMRQVVQIGLRSTSIALLTSTFSAMVITVQFALQLARFGAKGWVGSVVGVTLARADSIPAAIDKATAARAAISPRFGEA